MELNLEPQAHDAILFEGYGGAYYSWTPAKSPLLATAKLGAGKLVLQPRGFALPHYADSNKIGYVIQGTCTVGFIQPNSPKEKVLIINKGDAIPVTIGTISWWFNAGDTDVVIIFLGETTKSYNPGQFCYFFIAGAISNLAGFSSEVISKTYGITDDESNKLAKTQTNALIVKIKDDIKMPDESNSKTGEITLSLLLDSEMTAQNLPLLEKVGLSASLTKLEPNSLLSPSYSLDGSCRIVYVVEGSGDVQIVGLNGVRVLDASVQEGEIFVVPGFFAVALIAGGQGIEFFAVTTSSRPEIGELGGKLSISPWKAACPSVTEASLNVDLEFVKFFKSKVTVGEDNQKT